MTENPFRPGNAVIAARSGPLRWWGVCRLICRVLLNLLNGFLAVLFLAPLYFLLFGPSQGAGASGTIERDFLLSTLGGISGIATGISTFVAGRTGRWLGLSPVLFSLLTALAANSLQLSMVAVVMWYPTVQRGCFGAMAGLGEALLVMAALAAGCVASVSSGLLIWLNAPFRR